MRKSVKNTQKTIDKRKKYTYNVCVRWKKCEQIMNYIKTKVFML